MSRPPKPRAVRHDPAVVYFKPAGVPMRVLEEVALGLDELEPGIIAAPLLEPQARPVKVLAVGRVAVELRVYPHLVELG